MYNNDHALMYLLEDRRRQLTEEASRFRLLKEVQSQRPTLWQQSLRWVGERIVGLGWTLQHMSGGAARLESQQVHSLWD